MSKKSKFQTEPFTLLLLTMALTMLLTLPQNMIFSSAASENTQYSISVSPTRIQEGFNTSITVSLQEANISTTYTFKVNVTSPNGVSYSSNVTVVTDGTGAGSNLTEFWSDFAGANTDLVGTYNVTLFNIAGNETLATANFTVEGICEVQTRNLAGEPLSDVTVEVYNATSGDFLNLSQTNETGWARFLLDAGNYTFNAFWTHHGNVVKVGELNWTFTENVALPLEVRLSNLKLTVTNETDAPIPFIDLNLRYNYTTRDNQIIQEPPASFTTNINGTVILQNVFTNISYLIEARRYDFLFNTTFIPSLPVQAWNNITIMAPTYTLFVQVLDSEDAPTAGLNVKAYEWSSGIGEALQSNRTDSNGNATFSLTFGRYRLIMYNDTTFVSEATVDLVQNPLFLVIRLDIYKVNLTVRVVDYFGQPIPNASVELQRKSNSDYETTQTKVTESNGVASFIGIIGGDSRVYVSVAGSPSEAQYLYVVDSKHILFKFDGYVAVAGYALETSQFVTMVIILIIIVAFIVASTYKRLPRLLKRRRK